MKFKYSPDSLTDTFTYQQGYMAIKEFYTSSLLNVGDISQDRVLDTKEVLSPLAHNFIVEKWLDSIDPRLKSHILNTRGGLITEQKPNLADIQKQLAECMKTLLAELDADTPHNPPPTVAYGGNLRGASRGVYRGTSRGIGRAGAGPMSAYRPWGSNNNS